MFNLMKRGILLTDKQLPPIRLLYFYLGTTMTGASKNAWLMCITPLVEMNCVGKEVIILEKDTKAKKLTAKDIKELEKAFTSLENETGKLGLALIDELRFTITTLRKLKSNIRKNGVVVEMQQGSYSIQRANPALQVYNVTFKNYQSLVKTIYDMIPHSEPDNDDFESDDL